MNLDNPNRQQCMEIQRYIWTNDGDISNLEINRSLLSSARRESENEIVEE